MSRAPANIIETVGLTKTFRDFWWRPRVVAVKNLDLAVRPGEVFGLLGPNGSGKSTTIKILLGLLHPTRGRVAVFGRPPSDVSIKARIGYLPEESYLYRFLNARETLAFYGKLFRIDSRERRRRTEKLLEMVGMQHAARRNVGEYSKGMARLIGLAQALINDPELLILDEPTAGLDPLGTRLIKDLIRDLSRRGKTIVLSSHLLGDVEDVCDRICILYGGEVRAIGDTQSLLSRQELTQITTERLSDNTIREVGKLIETREHKSVVDVSAPSDKLETLFLRIVRQAQAQMKTSGVGAQGARPDFLAPEDGQRVIEDLLGAAETPAAPQPESATPPEREAPAAEVLDALTNDRKPTPDEEAADTEQPSEPAVDRSLIDSLTDQARSSRRDDHA